jgi:hypothetical protein
MLALWCSYADLTAKVSNWTNLTDEFPGTNCAEFQMSKGKLALLDA